MHACMCVCVYACMCVCVAKPVAFELCCHETARIFSFMDSFVFKHQVLLKKSFFGAFIFLLCNQSYLKNRYYSRLTFSL